MSDTFRISIPHDYSPSPAGRTKGDGPFNGARFRDDFLAPRLRNAIAHGRTLVVNFDDADSYSSSFLEEAFGGLIRISKFSRSDVAKSLQLMANDSVFRPYVMDAKGYLEDALKKA